MNINVLGFSSLKLKKIVKQTASKALQFMQTPCVELTIKFVSSNEIKRLNCQFRNINKVTDVLSFPATNTKAGEEVEGGEGTYLGDMAICLKQAKAQAKQYNTTIDKEVQKLVVHSVLHLLGYDHISDVDYKVMQQKEDQIAQVL